MIIYFDIFENASSHKPDEHAGGDFTAFGGMWEHGEHKNDHKMLKRHVHQSNHPKIHQQLLTSLNVNNP